MTKRMEHVQGFVVWLSNYLIIGILCTGLGLGGCKGSKGDTAKDASVTPPANDAMIKTPVASGRWAVVFVAPNDTLNVRSQPGVGGEVTQRLGYDTRDLRRTGRSQLMEKATWFELESPSGWVNRHFLTLQPKSEQFQSDVRPEALLRILDEVVSNRGDLRSLTSSRGLYVGHFGALRRYRPAALETLLASDEVRRWDGPACGEACIEGSFHTVIGKAYLKAYRAQGRRIAKDRWLVGGNASIRPPAKLANFHYISIFDRGTQEEGLDWSTFVVYFEYEDDQAKIVAVLKDAWSP